MTQQTVHRSVTLVQNLAQINLWLLIFDRHNYLTKTGFLVQRKDGMIFLTRNEGQENKPFLIKISLMQQEPLCVESMLQCLHQICDHYEAQYLKPSHSGAFSMTTKASGCLFNFHCHSSEVIDILKFLQRLSTRIV